jgi:hypothetical protein
MLRLHSLYEPLFKTTNKVESVHSVRRTFADKRLNFRKSYVLRANLALFSMYCKNWQELIFQGYVQFHSLMSRFFRNKWLISFRMGLGVSSSLSRYFESWETLNKYNKRRRETRKYQLKRFQVKNEKFSKKETQKFSYKEQQKEQQIQEKINNNNNNNNNNNTDIVIGKPVFCHILKQFW